MAVDGVPTRNLTPSLSPDVRLSTRWEAFILGLTLLSFCNIIIVLIAQLEEVGEVALTVDITITVAFVVDFVRRFTLAPNRRAYMQRGFGWLDLIGCLPGLRIVRMIRVVTSVRRLRNYGGVRPVAKQVFANRAQGSLLLVTLIAIYVIEFGSIAMLGSEARSPDANITTSSDALWYIMVTISTVGYGDLYPTTAVGRIVGVVILIVGVGLFTTLTGFLANIFVTPAQHVSSHPLLPRDNALFPGPHADTSTATTSSTAEPVEQPEPVMTPMDRRN
jgi:voltage-gated potassium channel